MDEKHYVLQELPSIIYLLWGLGKPGRPSDLVSASIPAGAACEELGWQERMGEAQMDTQVFSSIFKVFLNNIYSQSMGLERSRYNLIACR